MSKTRIVIFGLAFGSAVMAGLLAKGFIGQKPDKEIVEINKVKTVDVLTASKDINMGERFVDGSTAWKPWPVENVTDPMITKDEKPDVAPISSAIQPDWSLRSSIFIDLSPKNPMATPEVAKGAR